LLKREEIEDTAGVRVVDVLGEVVEVAKHPGVDEAAHEEGNHEQVTDVLVELFVHKREKNVGVADKEFVSEIDDYKLEQAGRNYQRHHKAVNHHHEYSGEALGKRQLWIELHVGVNLLIFAVRFLSGVSVIEGELLVVKLDQPGDQETYQAHCSQGKYTDVGCEHDTHPFLVEPSCAEVVVAAEDIEVNARKDRQNSVHKELPPKQFENVARLFCVSIIVCFEAGEP
jgi:hypothetical protein